jgi:hypothetical protein
MSTSLTFTSAPFGQNTAFASAATSETTILTADATYARRLYGIVFTNSAAQTPTCTIKIKDGSANVAFAYIVTVTTGVNILTDIFGSSAGAGVFQKKKDATGTFYYDLPANWIVTATLSANSTSSAYIHVYGETYQ